LAAAAAASNLCILLSFHANPVFPSDPVVRLGSLAAAAAAATASITPVRAEPTTCVAVVLPEVTHLSNLIILQKLNPPPLLFAEIIFSSLSLQCLTLNVYCLAGNLDHHHSHAVASACSISNEVVLCHGRKPDTSSLSLYSSSSSRVHVLLLLLLLPPRSHSVSTFGMANIAMESDSVTY
jgi:hypothetical protein